MNIFRYTSVCPPLDIFKAFFFLLSTERATSAPLPLCPQALSSLYRRSLGDLHRILLNTTRSSLANALIPVEGIYWSSFAVLTICSESIYRHCSRNWTGNQGMREGGKPISNQRENIFLGAPLRTLDSFFLRNKFIWKLYWTQVIFKALSPLRRKQQRDVCFTPRDSCRFVFPFA